MKESILVTGGTGFVGRSLVPKLVAAGHEVVLAVRRRPSSIMPKVSVCIVGEIGPQTIWDRALDGRTALVHLAARTPAADVQPEEFKLVNDLGTERLTNAVKASKVGLIVNLSSAHAIVDNQHRQLVQDHTEPDAMAPYSLSKRAGESHVSTLVGAGRAAVSLRPPIVYGLQATGNWRALLKLAASNVPLPFGAVRNRRSMINVDNLTDAILAILARGPDQRCSGRFNIADDGVASLRDVITWLRSGMDKPARLFPMPPTLIELACKAIGRSKLSKSLLGNLELDCSRFAETFSWKPRIFLEAGIKRNGAQFLRGERE